jgi:hypothetical protein
MVWSSLHRLLKHVCSPSQRGSRPERRPRAVRFHPRLEALEDRTVLDTVTWTGLGGDFKWGTPTNWKNSMGLPQVPTAVDDAIINLPTNVSDDSGLISFNSLTLSNSANLRLTHGLTLNNSTVNLGIIDTTPGTLTFQGTQLLGGTGTVVFGGSSNNALAISGSAGSTLTIGTGITVQGKNGSIGSSSYAFINKGTISADVASSTFNLNGTNWSNQGTVRSTAANALLHLDGTNWSNSGTIQTQTGSSLWLSRSWSTSTSLDYKGNGLTLDGTWTNSVALTVTTGSYVTLSGNWSNSSTISISNVFSVIYQGNWSNTGTIITTNGNQFYLQGQWNNQGNIAIEGATAFLTQVYFGSPFNNNIDKWSNQGGTIKVTPHYGVLLGLYGQFTTANLGTYDFTNCSVVLGGVLDNSRDTLNLNNSTSGQWSIQNQGTLKGGTVTGTNGATIWFFSNNGTLSEGVILNIDLDLTLQAGARATVMGGATLNGTAKLGNADGTTSGKITFQGKQTLDGTGTIVFGGSSNNLVSISGDAGSQLTIAQNITVRGQTGAIGSDGFSLDSKGTIAADVASGTLTIQGTWTNEGTIRAQNGGTVSASTPTNYSAGTLTGGTWQVYADSILRVVMDTGIVTNAATILLDGATSNFYSDSGTTDALASTFAINAAAGSFTIQNGRNFTTSFNFTNDGTLNVGAASTFVVFANLTNYDFPSGTLTSGTYIISGTFQFTLTAIYTNKGTIVLDGSAAQIIDKFGNSAFTFFDLNTASANFTVQNGAAVSVANGSFENDGTLKVGNNSTFSISGIDTDNGTLTVLSGGTLSLAGGGSASGTVSNAGLLIVGPGNAFTVSGSYSQSGTLQVGILATVTLSGSFSNYASGTLTGGTYQIAGLFQFNNAGITTNAAEIVLYGSGAQITDLFGNDALARTFLINQGSFSVLGGAAFTTAGPFENDGTLVVGAGSTFSVSGNFVQGATATLDLQLGGTSAGQYGTLAVTGTATLAGTLQDTLVNGYMPTTGDTFPLLTYGARSGDFATGPAGFNRNFDDVNGILTLVAQ